MRQCRLLAILFILRISITVLALINEEIPSKFALVRYGETKPTFSFYNEMQNPPIPGFQCWCSVNFTENHSNRQYVQPPNEWTNLTLVIPNIHTNEVQLTAWNTSWGPDSYSTSAVMYFSHVRYENYIFMSIIWWGPPWQLKVGWRGGDLKNECCTKVFR